MEEHPIQGLMTTAMENLKDMVEVNTIIGDAIESPDGSVIIPVSKLGFGFAAGGSEFVSSNSQGDDNSKMPFGGGSGGGVSITPVAFLIVSPKGIKMVHLDENTHLYEKIIDFAPKAVDKIQAMLKESGGEQSKDKKESKQEKPAAKKNRKKQSKNKKEEKGQEEEEQDQESDDDEDEMDYDI